MDASPNRTYELKSTFGTLPNYLTLLRIILVPILFCFC